MDLFEYIEISYIVAFLNILHLIVRHNILNLASSYLLLFIIAFVDNEVVLISEELIIVR